MEEVKRILIGGEWVEGSDVIEVRSPYSGDLVGRVFSADATQNEDALSHAVSAVVDMSRLGRFQIARGLRNIARGIEQRRQELMEIICLETAKPMTLCRAEIERAISTFDVAAAEAERFVGEVVPVDTQAVGKGKFAYTKRIPKGVVYGITPFNYPINLAAHKIAPALASGNAVIIKPSPRTPLSVLILGEIFLASGLPRKALQIVPTDVSNIDAVITDDRVAMVSFTGSADVGWGIKSKIPKKTVALELGGAAPVIVDETVDLKKAVEKCLTGAFVFSGQVCISVQRIYVQASKFTEFSERFVEGAQKLKVGDPKDESTQISAMIDEAAAIRAESWISEAVGNGATLLCGGKREGSVLSPTVLTDTNPEMRVASQEIFAPVCIVESFAEFDDAMDRANATRYGLQAAVFTSDITRANRAADLLKFGGVMINEGPTFRVDNMPYGGVKDSGYGREGVRYAMEEMTDVRIVVMSN
jgi:acyl-CoA reductase-like NAD-dependent aldehyde dehydrogenase